MPIKIRHRLDRDELASYRKDGISLNHKQHAFQFKKRWFTARNIGVFSKFLLPKFDGSFPIRILQIGIWEGMDLVWQFQTTAKHPDSSAVAIDPWLPMIRHSEAAMQAVEDRARYNLAFFDNCDIVKAKSQQVMSTYFATDEFDLVVIDGDHKKDPCYLDAVESFRIVKPGGWMLFDDVRNRRNFKKHVWHAVTDFVKLYDGKVKLAWDAGHCSCLEKV